MQFALFQRIDQNTTNWFYVIMLLKLFITIDIEQIDSFIPKIKHSR